jgi:signal transduction histidine kinase
MNLRDLKPFLLFLPFMVIVLGIVTAYLSFPINLIVGGFLLAAGVVVFIVTRRTVGLRAESATKTTELARVLEVIDDALVVYDENFKIRFFNAAAEKLFGVKAVDLTGRAMKPQDAEIPGRRLLTQVMFPTLAPRMVSRSEPGVYPQEVDISFEAPALELRVLTSKIMSEQGVLIGFLKAIKNRTREVGLMRSKNDFVTIASHQLRTPITEITWALESLAGQPSIIAAADVKELVDKAVNSEKKLSTLVEDLLNISRIEEGRYGYEFKETDVVEFLGSLAAQAMGQAERAGLKLYFDRPAEALPKVMIDASKLGLVVSNLLDNAVRYNVEHGEITLGVHPAKEGPFLEISVKDSGIGVPSEEIAKLFTKFFRAPNAVKFATEGSGLGLYIAKNIVEAHGGQMWAESEMNRGSTFYFTLPTDPSLVPTSEPTIE